MPYDLKFYLLYFLCATVLIIIVVLLRNRSGNRKEQPIVFNKVEYRGYLIYVKVYQGGEDEYRLRGIADTFRVQVTVLDWGVYTDTNGESVERMVDKFVKDAKKEIDRVLEHPFIIKRLRDLN